MPLPKPPEINKENFQHISLDEDLDTEEKVLQWVDYWLNIDYNFIFKNPGGKEGPVRFLKFKDNDNLS